jgi:hypothetical protein
MLGIEYDCRKPLAGDSFRDGRAAKHAPGAKDRFASAQAPGDANAGTSAALLDLRDRLAEQFGHSRANLLLGDASRL